MKLELASKSAECTSLQSRADKLEILAGKETQNKETIKRLTKDLKTQKKLVDTLQEEKKRSSSTKLRK